MSPSISAAPTPFHHSERFTGGTNAVPAVRAFIAACLRDYPAVDPQAASDLVLAASEFATNAVLHSQAGNGGDFIVTLDFAPRVGMHLEVHDPGPVNPFASPRSRPADEHGRGLGIVTSLAVASGYASNHGGGHAWADFSWRASRQRTSQTGPGSRPEAERPSARAATNRRSVM